MSFFLPLWVALPDLAERRRLEKLRVLMFVLVLLFHVSCSLDISIILLANISSDPSCLVNIVQGLFFFIWYVFKQGEIWHHIWWIPTLVGIVPFPIFVLFNETSIPGPRSFSDPFGFGFLSSFCFVLASLLTCFPDCSMWSNGLFLSYLMMFFWLQF